MNPLRPPASRRRFRDLAILILVGHASGVAVPAPGAALRPGTVWKDTAGAPIQAHGGGLLRHEGTIYWYGEHKEGPTTLPEANRSWDGTRVPVTGIHAYASTNLLDWHDLGLVLRAVPEDPSHDLHPSKVCERPKVIFNPRTRKFVLWMHVDTEDYQAARAGVAVADQPTGPFTYLGSSRLDGLESRDQTLFQDTDGQTYQIFSSEGNHTTVVSLLTDDALAHSGRYARIFIGRRMEAPAVWKHAGRYWFIGSGCTGWDPNAARCAVAASIWGPWTELGNPCRGPGAETTFDSQGTFVFPMPGEPGAFVFLADRWNKARLPDSRPVWLPLRFVDDRPVITWKRRWAPPAPGDTP